MKPKVFLIVTALIAAIFGVFFIGFSGLAMGMVGIMGNRLIAQILGANLIGFAVLNFFARNLEKGPGLRVILLANLVSDALGLLFFVYNGLTAGLAMLGWIEAAFYLLFALGFGFYFLYEPRKSTAKVPCPAEPC